nr:DUF2927 domain-containing protein [uncultured Celeribacter sp.]
MTTPPARPHAFFRFLRPLGVALATCATLSGCVMGDGAQRPQSPSTAKIDLPPMKLFPASAPGQTSRSNASIAQDFLELSFALENGTPLHRFTRFEGPITLRITGARIPVSLGPDLAQLLARLDREAGISITRVPASSSASITIQTLPHRELARRAPNSACIVAPNVSDWSEFKHISNRKLSWTTVETRERLAIFIPDDEAPQEIRDCLHEELAQALGPLNDLFRLPDSVFNDDNIHSVLTPFDMVILRATYAPELHSGMDRAAVAARLPAILDRIHPSGRGGGRAALAPSPRAWVEAVTRAMDSGSLSSRQKAAERAVAMAQAQGWQDTRAGFSWFLLGRLTMTSDPARAQSALLTAARIYGQSPQTRFHSAHVAMHLSAMALSAGQDQTAYEIAAHAIAAARDSKNAALLASLMLTEAEALQGLGRLGEARSVRLDSLGWARYGFGSDALVQARVSEVAAIAQ